MSARASSSKSELETEPEEAEEPDLTGDIFIEAFHRLSYDQQYRLLAALLADFHLQ